MRKYDYRYEIEYATKWRKFDQNNTHQKLDNRSYPLGLLHTNRRRCSPELITYQTKLTDLPAKLSSLIFFNQSSKNMFFIWRGARLRPGNPATIRCAGTWLILFAIQLSETLYQMTSLFRDLLITTLTPTMSPALGSWWSLTTFAWRDLALFLRLSGRTWPPRLSG